MTRTIIGGCCSPRPQKTTYEAMSVCLAAAGPVEGVRTKLIELTSKTIRPCEACGTCKEQLICASDGRPTEGFGATLWSGAEGGLADDKKGLETARNLGHRVAEIVKRVKF